MNHDIRLLGDREPLAHVLPSGEILIATPAVEYVSGMVVADVEALREIVERLRDEVELLGIVIDVAIRRCKEGATDDVHER